MRSRARRHKLERGVRLSKNAPSEHSGKASTQSGAKSGTRTATEMRGIARFNFVASNLVFRYSVSPCVPPEIYDLLSRYRAPLFHPFAPLTSLRCVAGVKTPRHAFYSSAVAGVAAAVARTSRFAFPA